MSESEKKLENALRKGLTERFADFELPVGREVEDQIFKGLDNAAPRIWSRVAKMLALLMLLVSAGLVWQLRSGREGQPAAPVSRGLSHHAHTDAPTTDKVVSSKALPSFPKVIADFQPKALRLSGSQSRGHEAAGDRATSGPERYSGAKLSRSGRVNAGGAGLSEKVHQYSSAMWAAVADSVQLDSMQRFGATSGDIDLVEQQPVGVAIRPPLPLPAVQAVVKPEIKPAAGQKLRFIFSIVPLQNFQIVTLRSTANLGIGDVRFAPVGSLESKGGRLSAGLSVAGFDLLANYSYLGSSVSYTEGSNRFQVQDASGKYEVVRDVVVREFREHLHLWGLGLRKSGRFEWGRQSYTGNVGLDYSIPGRGGQHLLSLNASFGKAIRLSAGSEMSIGPFVQASLNQRTVIPGVWQARPYQVGIALDFRLKR